MLRLRNFLLGRNLFDEKSSKERWNWLNFRNDGKHSKRNTWNKRRGFLLHIRHIKLKMNTLEYRKHAHNDTENSAFPRENSLHRQSWNSVAEAQQSKQWRKQKTTKNRGGAVVGANRSCRRRREILWRKEQHGNNVRQDWFFSFFFHRCLVCEVRSRDLYFQFVHKYRSAYT